MIDQRTLAVRGSINVCKAVVVAQLVERSLHIPGSVFT